MLISIIIVNHNTGAILKDCINSVLKHENSIKPEIIIIDNFSSDDSREIIKELTGKENNISSIFTDSLISFSAANNLGIKKAKGEYVLIMNPDIIFTEPVLESLVSAMKSNGNIGAISPALKGTDGNFQRNYFQRFPTIRQFVYFFSVLAPFFNKSAARMNRYLENQEIDVKEKKIFYTEQIPCAFFLTTKQILSEAGFMDERYILFFEDVDLSYSIHKKYLLTVDTNSQVTHLGGSSFKTNDNWWLHGRFIYSMYTFFSKNYTAGKARTLKFLIKLNSYFIIFIENIKGLFGNKDDYRYKKHDHLLKLFNEK